MEIVSIYHHDSKFVLIKMLYQIQTGEAATNYYYFLHNLISMIT